MKIYIGYDEREAQAASVALRSLHRVCTFDYQAELLDAEKLAAQGLLNRLSDHRGAQDYDLVSNAKKSTRFAVSRFLVPLLCHADWALFVDCDVVFLRDPAEMFQEIGDGSKAVYVVQHDYTPSTQWKMVNQQQDIYPRKNWSSVMLFNCSHPANRRLTLWDVNNRPGRDLHRFYWLNDSEIGALDPKWNWLCDEQPRPEGLGIAHMTLGGPWIPGWVRGKGCFDEEWLEAAQ